MAKCLECNGLGEIDEGPLRGKSNCQRCNGVGRLEVPGFCRTCNGLGVVLARLPGDLSEQCVACKGSGAETPEDATEEPVPYEDGPKDLDFSR